MVPMSDGTRMAADIYRPRNVRGRLPIIFERTPYNFNYWDVKLDAPSDMSVPLRAIRHGYAYVE
jgi:predicted acyl esterase